jgi:hypothetical protein
MAGLETYVLQQIYNKFCPNKINVKNLLSSKYGSFLALGISEGGCIFCNCFALCSFPLYATAAAAVSAMGFAV